MRPRRPAPALAAPDLVRELRALLDRFGGLGMIATRKARPRVHLLAAYKAELRRRNVSPAYVAESLRYLDRVIPAKVPLEEVSTVDLALGLDRIEGMRAKVEAARVVKSFFGWVVGLGELATSPAHSLVRARRVAVRIQRRALALEEIDAMMASPVPFVRRALYMLALSTGLRKSVMRRLRWTEIDWTGKQLRYVTKGGKMKLKPIPALALEVLRDLFTERKLCEKVFPAVSSPRTFQKDLIRAGITSETGEGRLDFHALRVTFCSRLAASATNIQTAQGLMDHSDPRLTTNIYSRIPSAAARDAVERSAPLLSESVRPRPLPKCGRGERI